MATKCLSKSWSLSAILPRFVLSIRNMTSHQRNALVSIRFWAVSNPVVYIIYAATVAEQAAWLPCARILLPDDVIIISL